jgi:ribonucleoside-diphosphate reductase subunit M2
MSNNDTDEPILSESAGRYTLFPIQYDDMYQMYKRQVDSFWRPEEVDLSRDLNDWASLSDDERHFIGMTLAFFAGSDGIVMENISTRFLNDVKVSEARAFYSFQSAMESIHSEMYSILIETYIKDSEQKLKLFQAIDNYPCIAVKAQWAQKWIGDDNASFASRLIAFACVEGIFFSSSFASIYWIKKRGLMPGLTLSNEFISRDEALHTEFAILLYSKLRKKVNKERATEIIREATEIEKEFITESLPCRLIGMNSKLMSEYIEFVADRLSLQLGYPKLYHAKNPFPFMERISLESKDNFFEKRVTTYAKANTQGAPEDKKFAVDADF